MSTPVTPSRPIRNRTTAFAVVLFLAGLSLVLLPAAADDPKPEPLPETVRALKREGAELKSLVQRMEARLGKIESEKPAASPGSSVAVDLGKLERRLETIESGPAARVGTLATAMASVEADLKKLRQEVEADRKQASGAPAKPDATALAAMEKLGKLESDLKKAQADLEAVKKAAPASGPALGRWAVPRAWLRYKGYEDGATIDDQIESRFNIERLERLDKGRLKVHFQEPLRSAEYMPLVSAYDSFGFTVRVEERTAKTLTLRTVWGQDRDVGFTLVVLESGSDA
jgi:hypothetical protein